MPSADAVPFEVPAEEVETFLAGTSLFHRCNQEVLTRVAPELQGLSYAEGTTVLPFGAEGEGIGIVLDGRASVWLPSDDLQPQTLELLLPGEHFGEVPFLLNGPAPYSIVADAETRILWMRPELAEALANRFPAFASALGSRMAGQIARLCTHRKAAPAAAAAAPAQQQPQQRSGVIPYVELREFDIQPSVLTMVPAKLVRQHRMLPLKLSGRLLTVGMVAPRNVAALAELQRTLAGVDVEVVALSQDDFNYGVSRFRLDERTGAPRKAGAPSIAPDSLTFERADEADAAPVRAPGDDAIRFTNRMIVAALDREASDIHLEPQPSGLPRIRFRANGVMQDWGETVPPGATHKAMTARLKVLAGLDITEKRLPQDGRIGVNAGKREIDLRVSTLPANRGEKIALRVLEAAGSARPLDQVFLEPATLGAVRRALNRPFGGIVIAGPTGSGKTTTLYSLLHERRVTRPDSNIIMVEDPIEYRLPGVTQVQVNAGAGLQFAQALRAMMRQDPDVIVVGETRDKDTAELALEAAMTGHLLLTSLHASDSLSVLQRLENLGCPRPLTAQALSLVVVQRLVRKLCTACRTVEAPPPALFEALLARGIVDRSGNSELPRANGCDACNGTGYSGRTAVLEVLQITDQVRTALAAGRPLEEVERLAFSTNALMPFSAYSAYLLHEQVISAAEVLLTLTD